jgi:hypothetical protein
MSPVARAICQALLDHHRLVCRSEGGSAGSIDSCLITYGDLCNRAGVPAVVRRVGHFLQEVAEWCDRSSYPPLNSLAVNQDSRMPGDNYDVAPGCSLLDWPAYARACIAFTDYPEKAP